MHKTELIKVKTSIAKQIRYYQVVDLPPFLVGKFT